MGRIRTLKPEILEDQKTAELDDCAYRVFIGLIMLSDDYGRGRADPRWLAGQILWGRGGTVDEIKDALATLSKPTREGQDDSLIILYADGNQPYYAVRQWERHQRVDKPGKPRIPAPDCVKSITCDESSPKSRETLATDLGPRTSDLGTSDLGASIVPAAPVTRVAGEVEQVVAHYRKHHPRALPRVTSASKEYRQVAARLREGYTVQDLCDAIDGCHASAWHMGQNDRRTRYNSLELITRTADKVTQFIEILRGERSGPQHTQKTSRTAQAAAEFARGDR